MAAIIWLGIAVAFGIVEAAAPALVCIWFCVGAAAAFVVSLFTASILVQVAVFLVVSCVALLALRPFFRKSAKVKAKDALTDVDAYVGREVTVTQRSRGQRPVRPRSARRRLVACPHLRGRRGAHGVARGREVRGQHRARGQARLERSTEMLVLRCARAYVP